MKKTVLILFCTLFSMAVQAQISTFPASEGFENPFLNTGINAQIYTNWTASEAQFGTRIFSDSLNPRTGGRALAAIPTSTFTATLTVAMNLAAVSNMTMNVWAKTVTNGTGDRQDIVYCSTSIDGGTTWSAATQLGDSTSFPNSNTSYANYTYVFPFSTNNQSNVLLKIEVTRGNGVNGGTAGRIVFDDLVFDASTVDVTPPTVLSAKATSATTVDVQFSEPVGSSGTSGSSYIGLGTVSNAVQNSVGDVVTLTLSTPLVVGQIYTLTVGNVSDLAGNTMTAPQNFTVVYNENTGNIKFTEIMYNNPGNDSLEYVELKNMDNHAINVGGWHFSNGVMGYFPSGLTIQAGAYILFAKYPALVNSFYQVTSYAWDGSSALNNAGETIAFSNSAETIIDSLTYGITIPWDSTANGRGPSLVLCNESTDNHSPVNWTRSLDFRGMYFGGTTTDSIFGSPGAGCTIVGLQEQPVSTVLNGWPSPAHDMVNIRMNGLSSQRIELHLFDATGRLISTTSRLLITGENTFQVPVSELAAGFYTIVVASATNQLAVVRFIKE